MVKELVFGARGRRLRTQQPRLVADPVLLVLTYHGFSEGDDQVWRFAIPKRRFERQVDFLRRNFTVVDLSEGIRRVCNKEPCGRPMVAITIDDGFEDIYRIAYPVLASRGLAATVFVATEFVDGGPLPWPTRIDRLLWARLAGGRRPVRRAAIRELRSVGSTLRGCLSVLSHAERDRAIESIGGQVNSVRSAGGFSVSWDQLREMSGAGFAVGSHTVWHGWLDRLPGEEIHLELERSRQQIEQEMNEPCLTIAYPNGGYQPAVGRAAELAGYRYAFTQHPGTVRDLTVEQDSHALGRLDVPYDEHLRTFEFRVRSALTRKPRRACS